MALNRERAGKHLRRCWKAFVLSTDCLSQAKNGTICATRSAATLVRTEKQFAPGTIMTSDLGERRCALEFHGKMSIQRSAHGVFSG
jgi:hypothetical protein